MSIEIKKVDSIKKVNKPWGYEKWIADGAPNFKYALKEIFFKSGFKSSIQFHQFKEETSYIQKGTGILYYASKPVNFEKFKNNRYTNDDIQKILDELSHEELSAGMVYHIKPGIIHRVEALTDLTIIESSTIELEDVIRINDEWGRQNGKIKLEHEHFLIPNNFYILQIKRIDFLKNHLHGKVLFCSYGINFQYTFSKALLENNCNEIWHYDYATPEHNITIRKLNQNNKIEYHTGPPINEIRESDFDCIVSSEELPYQKNPKQVIERYFKLLKNGGMLIVSAPNSKQIIEPIETDLEKLGFSKNELLQLMKSVFPSIQIFSQRNISRKEQVQKDIKIFDGVFSKFKIGTKKILNTVDKKQNFYKLHLQKSVLQLRNTKHNLKQKILNIDNSVVPLSESDNPTTFLLICKKSANPQK